MGKNTRPPSLVRRPAVNGLNLAIRFFVVELGALAAAAYWGWEATSGPGRWYLAVLAPAAVIVVWALFVSPRARILVSKQAALAIELVLLGLVTVGTGCILEHGDGRWLRPGDEVELEVEGIGVLVNRVATA